MSDKLRVIMIVNASYIMCDHAIVDSLTKDGHYI